MLTLCCCSALAIICVYTASAEETRRGRLPDGRAYRIDGQGSEIVDFTAELEVTVDTLKQQVESLESDLAERERELEELRSGRESSRPLSELDLVNAENSRQAATSSGRIGSTSAEDLPHRDADTNSVRCGEVEELVRRLERENQLHVAEIAGLRDELAKQHRESNRLDRANRHAAEEKIRPSVSHAQEQPLAANVRAQAREELGRLQSLISQRDRALSVASGRRVSNASDYKQLSLIRQQLEQARSQAALAHVHRQMRQMRTRLEGEISVVTGGGRAASR